MAWIETKCIYMQLYYLSMILALEHYQSSICLKYLPSILTLHFEHHTLSKLGISILIIVNMSSTTATKTIVGKSIGPTGYGLMGEFIKLKNRYSKTVFFC